MRISSNSYENRPEYIREVLRYNYLHSAEYNPRLDNPQNRAIFKRVLNIPIDFCNIRYYEKKDKESKGIEARFVKSDIKRKQHASTKPKSLLTVRSSYWRAISLTR